MSNLKQIAANQLNAEKSTGPKTEEGKATVSRNATKHGLLSSQTILPWEDGQSLAELAQGLQAELQPKGELERVLVDRIVAQVWRLRRAGRIEVAILAIEQYEADLKRGYAEAGSCLKPRPSVWATKPEKPEVLDQEKLDRAERRINEIQSRMNEEGPVLGRGYAKQAPTLTTLHRYETNLERSLFKAIHELQRIQAMRLGVAVALPVAVDIQGDAKDF